MSFFLTMQKQLILYRNNNTSPYFVKLVIIIIQCISDLPLHCLFLIFLYCSQAVPFIAITVDCNPVLTNYLL